MEARSSAQGITCHGRRGMTGKEVWGTGGNLGLTRDASHAEFITIPNSDQSRRPNERRCVRRLTKAASPEGVQSLPCPPRSRYAGVMLSVKFSQFWSNSANCDSVRDRGTECTVHRAEDSRRREVAKPGIALGSGPRDRGFESRLPDHSQRVHPSRHRITGHAVSA